MKVSDEIDLIDGTMANVYVLKTGGKIIQIDSGMGYNAKKIKSYYESRGIKPDSVFITHYHTDHIGGLEKIIDWFNPELYSSATEIKYLTGEEPIPKLKGLVGLMSSRPKKMSFQNVKECENIGVKGLECISTPGHTPGSTSLLFQEKRFIFIGDAARVKNDELEIVSGFTLDMEEARKSLEKIKSLRPVTILPGHGNPVKLE